MIDDLATAAAVRALNHLLAREAWARARLAPYAGRSARIEAAPFAAVSLAVADDGTFAAAAGAPSVTLGIDPAAVPALLFDPSALMRNVRLSGDAEFAQALGQVLPNLRPEPEEDLARFVGDAAAVRIVGVLRQLFAVVRDGGARFATSTADYLVAENPMLAARGQVDAFIDAVTALRDGVERLAKRVERLERQRGTPADAS